jgi:hypothetical protein
VTRTHRTAVCTVLILLFAAVLSFASSPSLKMVIRPVSDNVRFLRYQTGSEVQPHWSEVEVHGSPILLEDFDVTRDRLFVQQSEDLSSWSEIYTYTYDSGSGVWVLCREPVKSTSIIDSVDVKVYGLMPVARSSLFYSYVLGAAVKMNVALDARQAVIGYGQIGYSSGPSKSDWVDTLQALNLSIGMGYRFDLTDSIQCSPELGYGIVLHLLYADFDDVGTKTLETFIDQQIRLAVPLSFSLSDTYSLTIAPVGVVFFEKDSIGALLGVQSGLRFNF